MNDNIKIGADLHAGDGGYSEGTQEKYDEFAKGRNQSLGNMRIKQLKEQAMEWVPNMADPDTKIRLLNAEKFAELIVAECQKLNSKELSITAIERLLPLYREHFGI
jgi:hypothetical protein